MTQKEENQTPTPSSSPNPPVDGRFPAIFNEEQLERLREEIYRCVDRKELSELGVKGVTRKILAETKDENGDYVFYDSRPKEPDKTQHAKVDTVRRRVQAMVDAWKTEIAPSMRPHLIEGVNEQAKKAGESPAALSAVAKLIEPDKHDADKDNRPALSPGAITILQRDGVGTAIIIGQDTRSQGAGDKGHECVDTVHSVADGQREDTTPEDLP